jgi:hypothetical protein
VAPDLPEWKRPGVITYPASDAQAFLDACTEAYSMSDKEHEAAVESAWQHMLEIYDAPVVNKIREDVVTALAKGNYERNQRDPFDGLVGLWARGTLTEKKLIPHGTPLQALKNAGVA